MMKDSLFVASQYLLPQHLLSRMIGSLAESEWPWLKNQLITRFADYFNVDWQEAEYEGAEHYASFNQFFTRSLKPGARPVADAQWVSPADGVLSQFGAISEGRIIQAKGRDFSVRELLASDQPLADRFNGGKFGTIYLSPRDYHRVHMPCDGELVSMSFVPGKLFSVNQATTDRVPALFARNERVVAIFETGHGLVAMVLVGAMVVASIETVWAGEVAPLRQRVTHVGYQSQRRLHLSQGEEMGRFKLGSTVVMLAENPDWQWQEQLLPQTSVKMGQALS